MTYDQVLTYYGGTQVKLAAALGITQGSVSAWGGVIPDSWQYKIEVITSGDLSVEPHLRVPANRIANQMTGQ